MYVLFDILLPKSICISRAVSNFYGTEIEIWAGFGPVGNTEKKNWANYEQLLSADLTCFHGQKEIEIFQKILQRPKLKVA